MSYFEPRIIFNNLKNKMQSQTLHLNFTSLLFLNLFFYNIQFRQIDTGGIEDNF